PGRPARRAGPPRGRGSRGRPPRGRGAEPARRPPSHRSGRAWCRRTRRRRCRAAWWGTGRCGWEWAGAGAGCQPAARSRNLRRLAGLLELVGGELDHAAAVPAPAAHHLIDVVGEHLLLLDHQVPAHAVVVEGLGLLRDGDVEAGEVAAAVTLVSRGAHLFHGSPRAGAASPVAPGLRSDAVEELALLGGELLLGEDAALAQVVELDEPVPYLEE